MNAQASCHRRASRLASLPLSLLVTGALIACQPSEQAPPEEGKGPPPVKVETVTVTPRPFAERAWLPAEVQPREKARVSAEAMGRIVWLCCDEGDAVQAGQVVARIDTALNQAQVSQAQAQLDQAERDLARLQKLVESGAATEAQLEAARTRRDAAAAGLAQALALMRKTTVKSPIGGEVARRYVTTGEVAAPGQPIFDLVDISKVKAVAGLPERDFSHMKEGQETEVRVDAWPGERFAGTVERIGLVAGPARTFPLEVTVDNGDRRLRPGMVGEVQLTKETFDSAIVIPQDAVIDEFDSQRVYVAENGVAKERKVTLGPRDGRLVVVTSGLEAGEALVVTGHRFLTDGRAVEVVRSGVLDETGAPTFAEKAISDTKSAG